MSTEEEVERVHSELIEQFLNLANEGLKRRHPDLVASAMVAAAARTALHARVLIQSEGGRKSFTPGPDDVNKLTKAFKKRVKQYADLLYKQSG